MRPVFQLVVLPAFLFAAGARGEEGLLAAPSAEDVKAKVAEVSASSDWPEEVKKGIVDRLGAVSAELERAAASRAESERLRAAVESAPADLETLRKQLAALEPAKVPSDPVSMLERKMSAADFKVLLATEEAALEQARGRMAEVKTAVASEKARPAEIPVALDKARKIVGDTVVPAPPDEPAAGPEPAGLLADRWLAAARKAAAQAEVSRLEQEQIGAATRLNVLEARLALATRQFAIADVRVAALRAVVKEKVEAVANAAAEEAEKARLAGEAGSPLADEVAALSRELQQVTGKIASVQRQQAEVEARRKSLDDDLDLAKRHAEVGGSSAAGQALLDQRRALPDPRKLEREGARRGDELAEARLGRIRIESERLRMPSPGDVPDEDKLMGTKRDLLEELSQQYDPLIRQQVELDVSRRAYLRQVREFREFLDEKLFWVPSSPPIGFDTFRQVPAALDWVAGPARWGELGAALRDSVVRFPFPTGAGLSLVFALWCLRGPLRRATASHSRQVRRISTDQYRLTLLVFGMAVVLALPWPLLLWLAGGRFWSISADSMWMQGVAGALLGTAPILFGVLLVRNVLLPDGLAEAHFRWKRPPVELLRRGITAIALVHVPAIFLNLVFFAETIEGHVHSAGRLVFIVAMLWMAGWFARFLRASDGVLQGHLKRYPQGALANSRMIWLSFLVLAPVSFAILAASGYYLTGLGLFFRMQTSMAIVAGGVVAYEMILRWFAIRERRIALNEALAQRKARQATAAATGEEVPAEVEEEAGLNLMEVGVQMRRLLRALVGSAVLALLWIPWADVVPVLRGLDSEPFVGRATVVDLLLAGLVVAATSVVAKNLPGILEIALLRGLPRDSGARYAVSSLAQYVVVAVGAVTAFQILSVDWSQFGWILAALSVGLGFGLQEVVANFVSGIVLLFERPIRVGDIVTVGGVTGTVSKIRIRATVITDWDRREFVVPNKEFITGQVLNWTLSNTINRLVLPVGVAYGSDPERVRQIVREILDKHPDVMADPPPLVNLEAMGDSSLNFVVRCYLPTLDRRLAVTHELYSGIHRRFREEGIEIPFPQRDLHLRGNWGPLAGGA